MNINIESVQEKDIITIKGLVMKKKVFDQVREVKLEGENRVEMEDLSRWLGYVREPESQTRHQTVWLIAMIGSTLVMTMEEMWIEYPGWEITKIVVTKDDCLQYECPTCRAEPHRNCKYPSGYIKADPHKTRKRLIEGRL